MDLRKPQEKKPVWSGYFKIEEQKKDSLELEHFIARLWYLHYYYFPWISLV